MASELEIKCNDCHKTVEDIAQALQFKLRTAIRQRDEAVALLKQAIGTIDYYHENDETTVEIQQFLTELKEMMMDRIKEIRENNKNKMDTCLTTTANDIKFLLAAYDEAMKRNEIYEEHFTSLLKGHEVNVREAENLKAENVKFKQENETFRLLCAMKDAIIIKVLADIEEVK